MKTNLMKRIAVLSAAASLFAFSATTAYAVDSPTASLAPSLGQLTDENGNSDTVLFTGADGNTYISPEDVTLEVHDLSQAHNGELPEITQMLEGAQAALDAAKNDLSELTPDVADILAKYNAENPDTADIKIGDLVVAEIFDVSLVKVKDGKDDSVVGLDDIAEKATFELTFPFDVPDFYILLHEYKDGEWKAETDVARVDNDTLRITVEDFSPFALVVEKTDAGDSSDDDSDSSSQQPTDNNNNNNNDASNSQNGENATKPNGSDENPKTGAAAVGISMGVFAVLGAAMILTRNKNDKEK